MNINPMKCVGNHSCPAKKVCPKNAIIQEGNALPYIDNTKCTSCKICVRMCPRGAIEG